MDASSVASIAALVGAHYESHYSAVSTLQGALARAQTVHQAELAQRDIHLLMASAANKHESMISDAQAAFGQLSQHN